MSHAALPLPAAGHAECVVRARPLVLAFGFLLTGFVACSKAPDPQDPGPQGDGDPPAAQGAPDGEALFQAQCALCHGATGDGQGQVQFDRPARSFIDGGFSFGNTPEALTRTVSFGIGGTPMPGFEAILTPAEIEAVVATVIAMGPERDSAPDAESTVLRVTDRPQVIRGGLPPIEEGLETHARGLLVGGVDGLTTEYATAPFRLLAVRQGDFVDRKDWTTRGGEVLEPLGQVIYRMPTNPWKSDWQFVRDAETQPGVLSRLKATEIRGQVAWVESEWGLPFGTPIRVRETTRALSKGGWSGFQRIFEFSEWPGEGKIALSGETFGLGTAFGEHASGVKLYQTTQRSGAVLVRASYDPEPIEEGEQAGWTRWTQDWLFGLEWTPETEAALAEAYQ